MFDGNRKLILFMSKRTLIQDDLQEKRQGLYQDGTAFMMKSCIAH